MDRVIIFSISATLIIAISWRTIFDTGSHGLYRTLSWLCIAWLFASNYREWFSRPFSLQQIFSWIFLIISAYMVITGVNLLKKKGVPTKQRNENALYQFEQTSTLVDTGIFKYIRHPMYSSLVFLTWGIYLKNPTFPLFIIALLSTLFLYLTAVFEEKECLHYFGEKYLEYMTRSKRFIPYLF